MAEVVRNVFVLVLFEVGGGSVCEKYLKANVLTAAMLGKGQQLGQTIYKLKSLEGKAKRGDVLGNKGFENSCIFQGTQKATNLTTARHMPKKIWKGSKFPPLADFHVINCSTEC